MHIVPVHKQENIYTLTPPTLYASKHPQVDHIHRKFLKFLSYKLDGDYLRKDVPSVDFMRMLNLEKRWIVFK